MRDEIKSKVRHSTAHTGKASLTGADSMEKWKICFRLATPTCALFFKAGPVCLAVRDESRTSRLEWPCWMKACSAYSPTSRYSRYRHDAVNRRRLQIDAAD